jgi:hypothetical protein
VPHWYVLLLQPRNFRLLVVVLGLLHLLLLLLLCCTRACINRAATQV